VVRWRAVVAGLAATFWIVAPARPQEPEQDLPEIEAIDFVGNASFDAGELLDATAIELAPKPRHVLNPKRLLRPRLHGSPFRRNTLERELRRMQDFYNRRGFGGASVRLDSVLAGSLRRYVRLRVAVREGPRTLIREIRFLPQPVFSLDELARRVPFRAGDPYPFSAATRGRATLALRLAFLERGYLGVTVADSTVLSPDSTSALLVYRMQPGPPYTIRAVSISGNRETRPALVRRELRIQAGQVYSYARVAESRQNLYNTKLFRSVAIREEDPDSLAATIDLAVRLVERPMAFFEAAVGLGRREDYEARAQGAWGHRNLFGRGHGLEFRSTVAYNLEQQGRNYLIEERLHYEQPHLFGTRVRFAPELAFVAEQRAEDIRLRSWRFDAPSSFRVGRYTTVAPSASFTFTTTRVERPEVLADDDLETRAVTLAVTRNASDDLFDPHGGGVASIRSERAGFGGQNYFTRLSGLSTRYVGLGRSVVALALRAGWVESYGRSRTAAAANIGIGGVPFAYLFRAGGSSTVRGFDNNSLGDSVKARVRVPGSGGVEIRDLDLTAGTVLLIGNIEWRRPLPFLPSGWRLGMTAFIDAGNVWRDIDRLRSARFGPRLEHEFVDNTDLRYGWGGGLRYGTPFGPIRIDAAVPLKRRASWRHVNLHLGLGHTF
jgi:outer membrane protein assembly complex protein YaeT